ncbi:protein turtle homolog B-like [Gouania willdenowi]|uniref:protein turtle homolog B-like n=1 Tax=Gouania willdenowi TaxID=441366 RepID=UPI0010557494|nr:protein turtle homolog B-like [Gouania willdenowi]
MIRYVVTLIASVLISSTRRTAAQGAHGVREEPQFLTARAGETVVLGCDVSYPLNGQPYVVEWFKYGTSIPFFINFRFYPPHVDPEYAGRATLYGKSSLRIEKVRSEDQGWYECKVLMLEQQFNTFHNGSWVHLTVNAPPTFSDTPPQYVEAKEEGSITLTCNAFGNPKPSVSWMREGSLMVSSAKYKEVWYEFRVTAVMDDVVSEPSNVVGVSSTDFFPPPELVEERGLARPVVAGIVATICFLAAAVLFSTMAACFVNKQRRRKLKRKRDPPLSITHCRKSVETPSSSVKASPESIRSKTTPSETSEDSHDQRGKKVSPSPGRKEELSLYKKTKRAISKKYTISKHESEATTPIELISRGPDGRFVIDPNDTEMSVKLRRIEGFPFVEESNLYPEFRQSDEENDDPRPLPPIMPPLRTHQISPISSQESYLQPPAYSPRFHRPFEGMTIMESSRLQAAGQIRGSLHHRAFYGYLGHPGDHEPPPPFYLPDTSPLSSVMSSPPYLAEGPFGHPMIPEEMASGDFPQYVSGFPLPLTLASSSRSPEIWQGLDFTFASLEGPQLIFPPHHLRHDSPYPPPPHVLPLGAFQPSPLPMPTYPTVLPLGPQKIHSSKFPIKSRPHGSPARHLAMQEAHLGQLRHTSHGMGVPVLPYTDTMTHYVPSTFSSLETRWYETSPRFSPRQARRMDSGLHQVVLHPSRLSPLTQSPLSSHEGSPEILVRPRPRPSLAQPSIPAEMTEITLLPPSTASFSRRSSFSSSPAHGHGSRRASPSYRSHMAFASSAASYPISQSPSPTMEGSNLFGQIPSQRRSEEGILPSQLSASGRHRGAPSALSGSERIDALKYQRFKKAKRMMMNNNNSKIRKKAGVSTSQTQQTFTSQVLQPEEVLYLRKRKKRPVLYDPYTRISALLYRRPPPEDQKAILASMDNIDLDNATLL